MADKKIQPKRPTMDEPAAGARAVEKTSARKATTRKLSKMSVKKQNMRKF